MLRPQDQLVDAQNVDITDAFVANNSNFDNHQLHLVTDWILQSCTVKYLCALYAGTGDDTVLRQVTQQVVQRERCRTLHGSNAHYVLSNMICAGTSQGGKSSCNGDSGGPLVCKQGDRWFQYGIVNFRLTTQCAVANKPTVYGSVVALRSWIQEKTGSLYCCITILYRKNYCMSLSINYCDFGYKSYHSLAIIQVFT